MTPNIELLQKALCNEMCANIKLVLKKPGLLILETPFFFPDGDPYQLYLKEMPTGILRLTDMGHTLMHLSYENDIDKFNEGTRGNLFKQILSETFVSMDNGALFIDTNSQELTNAIFRLGQAITKVNDLTFLNRARTESTFYEDLREDMYKILPPEKIEIDYIYSNMESAGDYPIDYKIDGKYAPLFVFGIPNRDKARLTNIVLERLLRAKADFDSLLIFSDQSIIPRGDLARLTNTGGEMIASLDAQDDLSRKLLRKVA